MATSQAGSAASAGLFRSSAGRADPLERYEHLAAWTPAVVAAYFGWQFLVRVLLSSNLEIDESELVGHIHFALGYGNSQPPLYNWIVGVIHALTGSWTLALAIPKHVLLAATYLLLYDTVRRATGRALPAALATMGLLFLPQIVWKAQITLSNSLLAMAAAAAALHAVVLIVQTRRLGAFVWLGFALGCGLMAKYNFALFVIALAIAIPFVPEVRRAVLRRGLLLSMAIVVVMIAPHFIWALTHAAGAPTRLHRLEGLDPLVGSIDLPGIGLDGLLSLILKTIAWAGPLALFWGGAYWLSRGTDTKAAHETPLTTATRRLAGAVCAAGLAVSAVLVIATDVHSVDERYLTPVLMGLPVWVALRWPLDWRPRGVRLFAGCAASVMLIVTLAWPSQTLFGKSRYAYPYAAMAADIQQIAHAPFAVLSDRTYHSGNIAIYVPGATVWKEADPVPRAVVVWEGSEARGDALAAELGPDYKLAGETHRLTHLYRYYSGKTASLNARLYEGDMHPPAHQGENAKSQ